MYDLADIRRLLSVAARRLAMSRLLRGLHLAGLVAAAVALVVALADRAGAASFVPWLWTWLALGLAAVVASLVIQRRTQPDELEVAVLVDERLGLRERLSNAIQSNERRDGFGQLVVEDGLAAARDPRSREAVQRLFPVKGPARWWMSPVIALIAVAVLQAPQADLFAGEPNGAASEEEVAAVREDAEAAVEGVVEQIKQSPELADALEGLGDELEMNPELPEELTDPEDIKRQAIKKLTETSKRLEELLEGETAKAVEHLEDMMRGIEASEGPAKDLSEAMKSGNFKAAKDAMEKMLEQVEAGTMSQADQEALAKQLEDLAKQLDELAKNQQGLEDALKAAGLNPQLASNPQALQNAIQNSNNLNDQQKQELMKQAAAMAKAQQMMQQMAKACQGMCQNMGQGQNGQMSAAAGQAGQAMAQQLSQAEMMQQMLQQAQAAMAMCQGQCQGLGQGMKMGNNMSQRGGQRGGGAAQNDVTAAPGQTVMKKETAAMRDGEVIARMLIDGEPVRGESKARLQEVVRVARTGFDDAIDEAPLPRRYHDAVKHYFGELARQVDEMRVETDPAPAPAPESTESATSEGSANGS